MNFIAHLLLSGDQPEMKLGNFMGDFVRNRDLVHYSPAVQAGVQLHRALDTFTDNHPAVRRGMRLLYPAHGKYAAVLIDLFFDFLLARHWDELGSGELRDFIDAQYRFLESWQDQMPDRLRERLPRMIADDWLMAYTSTEGLDRSIGYMKRRVSKPACLDGATNSLKAHLPDLDRAFLAFFPDARAEAGRIEKELILQSGGKW